MSEKRMRVHRHNGYRGSLMLARSNLMNIIVADSTSSEAKIKAQALLPEIEELHRLLEKRIDPKN